jgi:hypothetical protein
MKSILTSASLVAIGVAGLHAQEASKPWNVSAAVRGFYDDNYATRPSVTARDSFGFELSPRASYNPKIGDLTTLSATYAYSMKYYEDRTSNTADHAHEADIRLGHEFTPRYKASIYDSFAVAQEPEIINPAGTPLAGTPLRANGNNFRNQAGVNGTVEMTEQFHLQGGYSNTVYDYQEDGPSSYSALLDRMEHLASINLRWLPVKQTVGVFGYQFGEVGFRNTDPLVAGVANSPTASIRDSRSHSVYVGGDHTFNPELTASVRAGAQFTEYLNAPAGTDQDRISPYADGNMTWRYMEGCSAQLGVKLTRTPIDLTGLDATNLTDPTFDQQSLTLYGAVNHRITPSLMGTLNGMFQNGSFEGGAFDGQSEQMYMLGVNLTYQFNVFLAAETGYSFDRLDTDVGGRGYSRNRVFIGVRGTY